MGGGEALMGTLDYRPRRGTGPVREWLRQGAVAYVTLALVGANFLSPFALGWFELSFGDGNWLLHYFLACAGLSFVVWVPMAVYLRWRVVRGRARDDGSGS